MSLLKSRFIEMFGQCNKEELIGNVVSICRGASPRPISEYITKDSEGINWIKIGDVSDDSLYITSAEEKITKEGASKSRLVHKGDFILSNSMSFGRPYILGIDGCVHDGWLILSKFSETFNEIFLYYALKSDYVQNQFRMKVNGATVKNLNSDLVKNTKIKVPPIEKQMEFSNFIEQIDKSKFLLQQILEKLELLKKSRFIEMFKNSETLRLDQIAEVTMGQSPDSSSYNSVGKGIPFYQGKTEFTDKYIGQPSTWCTSPTRIAKENDILMSVRAPVGNVNIATEECCIGRGLSSIRPQNGFNSEFIFEALEQKKEELENKATGSTFKAINKDIVLSIQIPNTSISIQKEYSNFVKQIDKSKFNVFQDQTAAQVKVIVVLHHIC